MVYVRVWEGWMDVYGGVCGCVYSTFCLKSDSVTQSVVVVVRKVFFLRDYNLM